MDSLEQVPIHRSKRECLPRPQPAEQLRGIGTYLTRRLCDQADAANLPLELQVLKVNPAKRLYERLGSATIGETDTHYLMRRPAVERT
jgi:ribosomal protein S18 acetylase RimI-like enzyme